MEPNADNSEEKKVDDNQPSDEIKDSIKFPEDIKIDWKIYPMLFQKCWDMQKTEKDKAAYPIKLMNPGESMQFLHEAIEFLFKYVDSMKLHEKDIFIVVGPSRTGKGTLLAAL